jgi:hypothetical protein
VVRIDPCRQRRYRRHFREHDRREQDRDHSHGGPEVFHAERVPSHTLSQRPNERFPPDGGPPFRSPCGVSIAIRVHATADPETVPHRHCNPVDRDAGGRHFGTARSRDAAALHRGSSTLYTARGFDSREQPRDAHDQ